MIFKRKIYDKLLKWKNDSNGSTSVLIEGARRIGKSTITEEFAKNEYKSYIKIDFAEGDKDVEEYFNKYISDLDTFFMLIQSHFNVKLFERESVLIFDEIQRFPRAREAIKYLVKDGRYDYIETGSLITIKENVKDIVIPSEEEKIKMYPMDFEEFADALNESVLVEYIKKCFEEKKELERGLHNKAMLLFKQYMLVGGMPQAVSAFIKGKKDLYAADKVKRNILNLYREDIMKINASYRNKVLLIFDQIPGFLSSHEKRVKFNHIDSNTFAFDYEDSFFWLSDSMICNECFLCNDPNVGLSLNEERSFIKCYLADTGLLVSHAFDENELVSEEIYKKIFADRLSINKGMLYENVIAQMLVSKGYKLYFYAHYNKELHRNDMEIDFIITNNSKTNVKIFPIEVKSSKNYSTSSLGEFDKKFKERIGWSYVIHPKNLKTDNGVVYIPPYMTFCL